MGWSAAVKGRDGGGELIEEGEHLVDSAVCCLTRPDCSLPDSSDEPDPLTWDRPRVLRLGKRDPTGSGTAQWSRSAVRN